MQDDEKANPNGIEWPELVGKSVLIGLAYQDVAGHPCEQRQLHGRILTADAENGIVVELLGREAGKRYSLPPDLRSFVRAKPGTYVLRSSGESVVDPDYMTTWVVEPPSK